MTATVRALTRLAFCFALAMSSTTERESFSARLREALKIAAYPDDSPTRLAREFNVRHDGSPVTVHAARKWLMGEAIPTQEKLRALAQWLGVTAEWLRFGDAEHDANARAPAEHIASADLKLVADLQHLDEHHQQIAREFLRMLARVGRDRP